MIIKNSQLLQRIILLFWTFFIVALLVLIVSVIRSALGYQFDHDELYHVQQVYLSFNGFKPYTGFYSVYSPFLLWLLTPLYSIVGFTFQTVSYARAVMIGLFALRMVLAFILVKRLFGKTVAALFMLLALLDPFTVFAAMQIRPENVMMVLYQLLLLTIIYAFSKNSIRSFFLVGVLAGATLIASLKIIPGLFIICALITYYLAKKRNFSQLFYFFNGFIVFFIVFFGIYALTGGLFEMFQQVFIDPFLLNNAIRYPTTLNYFYFSNQVIYGFEGKPPAWYYAISLPVLAFAGGYKLFTDTVSKLNKKHVEIKQILFLSFVVQWASMMFVYSVWIQYYIPLLWLYALFTAVLLHDCVMNLKSAKYLKTFFICFCIVTIGILTKSSILGNINRSHFGNAGWETRLEPQWARIPKNAEVFPNILFRKLVYPIPYGGTYAEYIQNRYAQIELILEKKKVPYIILEGDTYENLTPQTQNYIMMHYKQDKELDALYLRQDKK